MRELQTEPNIIISIQPSEEWINFIDIVIQNIGMGPARFISFKTSSDFEYEKGKLLSELGFMKQGLKVLAPNQKFKCFLTSILESWEEKIITPTSEEKIIHEQIKMQFDIKVIYHNSEGKKYDSTYPIDFSYLADLTRTGKPPLYKISDNIEKIKKHLLSLSNECKMNVVVHTKKDLEEEKERKKLEWEKIRERRSNLKK